MAELISELKNAGLSSKEAVMFASDVFVKQSGDDDDDDD